MAEPASEGRVRRWLGGDKLRFVLAGGSTTAVSYALYLLLLALDLPPTPAYVIAYIAGIGWSYAVNALWVFRAPMHWRSFFRYPLVYLVQAVASVALFKLLIGPLAVAPWLAPLVVVVATIPLTYVLSRAIITRRPPAS